MFMDARYNITGKATHPPPFTTRGALRNSFSSLYFHELDL